MSDKELAEMNKQIHLEIKSKKKEALKTAQDKEEFQRLAREIEKESVSSAVNENSKVNWVLFLFDFYNYGFI